jgi:hypothetical protein
MSSNQLEYADKHTEHKSLHPEDEQLIYSKHEEDIYWNKFKKESASGWFLLRKYITTYGSYNVKGNESSGFIKDDIIDWTKQSVVH